MKISLNLCSENCPLKCVICVMCSVLFQSVSSVHSVSSAQTGVWPEKRKAILLTSIQVYVFCYFNKEKLKKNTYHSCLFSTRSSFSWTTDFIFLFQSFNVLENMLKKWLWVKKWYAYSLGCNERVDHSLAFCSFEEAKTPPGSQWMHYTVVMGASHMTGSP